MTAPPSRPAAVSVLDAARDGVEHTRSTLFPFRFDRWLALGFVAFLDQCGRTGGGSGHVPGGPSGETGDPSAEIARALHWLGSHVGLVTLLAALALSVLVALTALVLWINSRAIFVYVDDVASGRSDVKRPWREHRERANSLFAWRFLISLATILAVLGLVFLGLLLALAVHREHLSVPAAVLLGIFGLLVPLLLLVAAAAVVSVALRDFVAPLQIRLRASCGEASTVFVGLVRSHPGAFVVYLLLKVALAVVTGLAVLLAGCFTCCCAFLPVVGQTLLQPLFYFERSWSLFLLRQMGHDLVTPAPSAV